MFNDDDSVNYGKTTYDFPPDWREHELALYKRACCAAAGPVAELLFKNDTEISLDLLGTDGDTIDHLYDSDPNKTNLIQDVLNFTAMMLNIEKFQTARQQIVDILIKRYVLNQDEFTGIMTKNNINQMPS